MSVLNPPLRPGEIQMQRGGTKPMKPKRECRVCKNALGKGRGDGKHSTCRVDPPKSKRKKGFFNPKKKR